MSLAKCLRHFLRSALIKGVFPYGNGTGFISCSQAARDIFNLFDSWTQAKCFACSRQGTLPLHGQYTFWIYSPFSRIFLKSFSTPGLHCGHESLSIFVHFVPNLLSVLDPASLVRKLTSFRPAQQHESNAGCFLLHKTPMRMHGSFV